MQIVLTGSVAYDCLMTFPGLFREQILPEKLESISLSFLVDRMVRHRGGIAANIAYTLALLGERPRLMATVGCDFGEYRRALDSIGVDTALAREIPDVFTGSFFATTDRDGCQIASFYPGAMARAGELSLQGVSPKPDLVVVSPNDPAAMQRAVRECRALGIPCLYDPSQQAARMDGAGLREGIDAAELLFCNEYEYELIRKKTGLTPEDILGKVRVLVVTLGEKGASITADGKECRVPVAPPDRIADPTGVGDAFRGGFLKGYSHGLPLDVCGKLGALAATYCLEKEGTQNHAYTRAEFGARYKQVFGADPAVEKLLI